MPILNHKEYQPKIGNRYQHEWREMLPYAIAWEALCPIQNKLVEYARTPTVEERNYHYYRETTKEHHPMNFRMWIQEPYLLDNNQFAPFKTELSIRINNGDDSYWRKEFTFTIENYDNILATALADFELLKLATTQDELIDTALLLGFDDF